MDVVDEAERAKAGNVLNDLYRLDAESLVWTALSPQYTGAMALARGAMSAVPLGGLVYVFGGYVPAGLQRYFGERGGKTAGDGAAAGSHT